VEMKCFLKYFFENSRKREKCRWWRA